RIEREESVERQRGRLAVERERLVAAQRDPVRIAHRRHRREPIERAAQYDDEQAWIAAFRARQFRQIGPGEQRAGGEEQFAARRGVGGECHRLNSFGGAVLQRRPGIQRHRRWNSGAMNRSASACGRLSARVTARRAATTHSPGRLSLARGASQDSGAATSAFPTSFKSPCVARKRFANRSTSAGGGSSATKWRASLVATCLAVAGWRASAASTARPCSTPPSE